MYLLSPTFIINVLLDPGCHAVHQYFLIIKLYTTANFIRPASDIRRQMLTAYF